MTTPETMTHHPPRDATHPDGGERLEEGLGRAQEALDEGIGRAVHALDEADSWLRDRVVEQPLLSLGIAAAAGYLMGRLLARVAR